MKNLAVISTHPIQYNAPWFRMLSERNPGKVKVFYTRSEFKDAVADSEFGRSVVWDIPLTEGYDFQWCENTADIRKGGFRQVINPSLIPDIEAWGAEAVLIFGWNYQSHLRAMRYFHGRIPVLFRGDSTLLDEKPGIKRFLRHLWLRYVYSHVDTALFVGQNNHDYFRKCGLHEWQLEFAPHAIDNARFGGDTGNPTGKAEAWRRELGYSQNDVVLLYCGKFSARKNVLPLLQSFLYWHSRHPGTNLKLLFAGNGELETELKKRAADCAAVQFLPFQNQSIMPQLYRVGDVFVLPSAHGETWGLGVNEAMASGRAAAVSDRVGCARDLIREGENGFLFSHKYPIDVFEMIPQHSRKELLALGENAKESIRQWDFYSICKAVENVAAQ